MDKIVIEGGFPLNGEIKISGAKNSAIKLMAVCLLTDEPVTLTNMPRLRDTRSMAELLRHLGVEVDAGDADIMLGAKIELDAGYVIASAKGGLKGAEITFPFVSVGATEHAILAAVLAEGETVLYNAAREPEIADLANCLNAMGAKIMGAGRSEVRIQGVDRLSGIKYAVVPDRIEAGTYALAAATAGGSVRLRNIRSDHLGSLWPLIAQAGAKVSLDETSVLIERGGGRPKAVDVDTMAYPGFPTDLQAQFMAFMCLADGVSIIRENIFENRFMHCPELARMGADITVTGREAIVRGVKEFRAAPVMATDLRASACLINAGLAARGETHISRVYHLDRGFEDIEGKLERCGARITRQKDD